MRSDVVEAISGGVWIFLGSLSISLTGLVFWLVISRLAGVEAVGVASAIVSGASIAVTVVSAGLNIAVVREVAAKGVRAFTSSIVFALIVGVLAIAVTVPLTSILGYGGFAYVASILALASVMGVTIMQSLIGFERFKQYFIAVLTGSTMKLIVGVLLAIVGFGALAPLIGYVVFPITVLITGLLLLYPLLNVEELKFELSTLKGLAALTLSNYPYMFSGQILTMLGVYIFAYLVREAIPTGTLYIALMITLSIASIPVSVLSASLPVGVRRGGNPFSEGFRIGLAVATPIIVFTTAAPVTILSIINPELAWGANTLRILLLSIAPLTALTTAIMKLNKEGDTRGLTVIGLARLILLITLLPLLVGMLGLEGAAVAFLLSNTLPLPLIVRRVKIIHSLIGLWGIQTILTLAVPAMNILGLKELTLAIPLTLLSIAIMHIFKIYTVNELLATIKAILVKH